MDDYDYKHVIMNDKLLKEDKPQFVMTMMDDPEYEAHHLNRIRGGRRVTPTDISEDIDEDTYEDLNFVIRPLQDIVYVKNPEITAKINNGEHSMESEECLSELRLELMDLARLADISFIDWFAVGEAKNKMLKVSEPVIEETPEVDTVKANTKYLNHMLNYDQNRKPKRTRRVTETTVKLTVTTKH